MADEFMTEERTALTATVRDFTAEHIVGNLPEWERTGDIPRELHKRAGDLGLLGIGFDESVGGSGGDLADGYAVTEAICPLAVRAGSSPGCSRTASQFRTSSTPAIRT